MSAGRENDGRRIARLFRQYRSLADDERICDLDRILEDDGIEVAEASMRDPGYTACLLRPVPDAPGGILLAPGQSRGRRRFSLAHELGHYHIPRHSQLLPGWCGDEDMTASSGGEDGIEWEANQFAAELLMPRHLFRRDSLDHDPGFASIIRLAGPDGYDVSITAAAIRYVDVAPHRCALVCAERGVIKWVSKSDDFFYRIPWIGDRVPAESVAADVFRGEEGSMEPAGLEPYVWLEVEQRRPVELFESTLSIPSQAQVLSLLWVVPEGSLV